MKYLKLLFVVLILFSGVEVSSARAATLNALPSSASVKKGDVVTVRIVVNPEGVAINNSEAILSFSSNILSVTSLSKSGSIFSLWVEDPAFSNEAGTITYNGGVPNPGFSGSSGTVLTATFVAKQAGTASLSFAGAAIRANDGNGTDVLSAARGGRIIVTDVAAAPVVTLPPTPTNAQPSIPSTVSSVTITSITHPDQSVWYANTNPVLSWVLTKSAEQVQLVVDREENAQPVVTYKPAITEKKITDLSDGTWYFRMRVREKGTWGETATYRLHIDTTPPEITSHSFTYDANTRALILSASSTDEGSGLAGYELRIDGGESITLDATAFLNGGYSVPDPSSGKHEIVLMARDTAGNVQKVVGSVLVPANALDTGVFRIGSWSITLFWLLLLLLALSVSSLVVAVFGGFYLSRHRHREHPLLTTVEKDVHRSFDVYRMDLEKNLRMLERAREKRALTTEEVKIHKNMLGNLRQLERYISERIEDAE